VNRDEPVYPPIWVFGSVAVEIRMIWVSDGMIFAEEVVIGRFWHIGESPEVWIRVRLNSQLDSHGISKLTYPRQ
jgi:hypothetical protein